MAHHEKVRRRDGDDRGVVDASVSHRRPTNCVAGTQLLASCLTVCLEQSAGDDEELMTQKSFTRQLGARRHAQLIDEREKPLELGGREARQFARGLQDPQPLPAAHDALLAESANEPSPTPPEKVSRIPGATRRSSLMTA